MTKEFLKLMELLQLGVFGTKTQNVTEADINGVLELAMKQGVLPIVYGSLEPEQKKTLNPKWEKMFFCAAMKNEQKLAALSGVIKVLEKNNIEYCILKGCTVALEYHCPEFRMSGDIDLYVKPECEKTVAELLKGLGFDVEERVPGKQDFKANSGATGLIEVHVMLYAEVFSREVLKNKYGITEGFRDARINEYLTVKALGINDMLDFLTTHFIKHFVREGSGIRQITDLLVFVEKHKSEIDFESYFEKLEEIKFKKLILNVFGIGVKYFNLNIETYLLDNAEMIMADVEHGENFGFGHIERFGFYEQFLARRIKDNDNKRKMASRKKKMLLRVVFLPGRKYLIKKGFAYLEKSSLLYPVAYIHRLWNVFLSVIFRKRKVKKVMGFASVENEVVNLRLKMMKELDII